MDEQSNGIDLTGKTLGHYQIIEQIGHGGMATVYRATQESIGREVAIKVMPPYFLHTPGFLERFKREVKVIAALAHPRILPIYDFGMTEDLPYIVMAYMEGGTLGDRIKQGRIPLDEVVGIIQQISEAMDFAHDNGVIHRDFKPGNILFDKMGNAYLADFGIAKVTEATVDLTGDSMIGTPSYMAPEMTEGRPTTPSVDIYALGITTYQMLAGVLPFPGTTPIQVILAHTSKPIPDIRVVRPDISEEVSATLRKAMAKNPDQRYLAAGIFARELAEAAGNDVATKPSPTPIEAETVEMTSPPNAVLEAMKVQERKQTPPPVNTASDYGIPEPEKKRGGCSSGMLWGIGGAIIGVTACIALFFWLAGVFGAADTATPTPANTIAPADTAIPTDTPEEGGNLRIVNERDESICYVYIAASSSSTWGLEKLGSDNIILPDASFTINNILPDTYDIKAENCNNEVIAQRSGVSLGGEESTWTLGDIDSITGGGEASASLIIANRSGAEICFFYIASSASDTWGPDQLGDDSIPDGTDYTIRNVEPDTYDLLAETCDGLTAETRDAKIQTAFTWTINPSSDDE